MEVILIAALAKNRVIGRKNGLPWHLPGDMAHFKRTTLGHPVIMGRKTFESFGGKPLPKRLNIILSRSMATSPDGSYTVCSDLAAALRLAERNESEKIFIAGGAEIYKLALESGAATQLLLTEIHKEYEGDTLFPAFGEEWQEISREKHEEFDIVTYSVAS